MDDDRDLRVADDLLPAFGAVRRAVRRRLRERLPGPPLGAGRVELLRVVEDEPGISVNAAARALHLAGNSVSTLVNQAVEAGLLHRTPDPADRRTARLTLAPAAVERLRMWRAARRDVVGGALAALDEADRAALHDVVPAVRRLLAALEAPLPVEGTARAPR